MKPLLFHCIIVTGLLATASLAAEDTELLAGKWSLQKVNDEGRKVTQTIETKPDKFLFQLMGEDGQVEFAVKGDFKVEKRGPFKTARFFHIKAEPASPDLSDLDDEYESVYMLTGDTWTLASNFDKDRQQKPGLDVYQRVKSPAAKTLVIDEIQMMATPQSAAWFVCFDVKTPDGASHRYHVAGKEYGKNSVTIPVALELPNVSAGQKCSFALQLDDIDDDACGDQPDNRSTDKFTVSESGSQSYKPEDNWRYTIRWHLK